MSIFISWSGEKTGKKIGELLKQRMIDWLGLNDADCYMSDRDMRAGDWRAHLVEEVERAEVGIVVLTREARQSEWIRWEVGGIEVNTKSVKSKGAFKKTSPIFPILFGAARTEDFSGGVFSFQQFFTFDLGDMTKLLLQVNSSLKNPISDLAARTNISNTWRETSQEIKKILDEAQEVNEIQVEGVFQKSQATLRDAMSSRGTEPSVIEDVLAVLDNYELSQQVAEIARTFYQCREQGKKRGTWAEIWADHTWNSITRTTESLQNAHDGRITLSSEEARTFWRRTIMRSVRSSIWTTNLGGHGRRMDASLRAAQEQAIDRSVTIERLFVYDETSLDEINSLRPVMHTQLEIGIKVHVVPQNLFYEYAQAEIKHIGSADFMLIDDEIVYVTNLAEHANINFTASNASKEILGVTLIDNPFILRRARELRSELMSVAKEVTPLNINDFPEFLQRRDDEPRS